MIDIEITKKIKLKEINNCYAHNFYYLYYGRIYNEDKTKYRKFKIVVWFDIFDVLEYFEKDFYNNEDIKRYTEEIDVIPSYMIKNFEDIEGLKNFYSYCNETISDYNKII